MTATVGTTPHPIFLAGRWVDSPDILEVANPARPEEPAGSTYTATPEQYETAVEAAVAAFEVTRRLPAYERGRILREISAGIKARREELGTLLATEAGASRVEVNSLHRQAIGTLSPRLQVEASADDGTVEAFPISFTRASVAETLRYIYMDLEDWE